MIRPRFTIGEGMIVMAALALFLALARASIGLAIYLAYLVANVGAGWWTWRACRSWPLVILPLNLSLVAAGLVLSLAAAAAGRLSGPWGLIWAWAVLVAPVVIGSAVAWLRTIKPDLQRADVAADIFLVLVFFSVVILAVPAHLIVLSFLIAGPD